MLIFSTTFAEHMHNVFSVPRTSLDKVKFFIVQLVIKKLNLVQNLWELVDTSRLFVLPVNISFPE